MKLQISLTKGSDGSKKVVIADYCTTKEAADLLKISRTGVYYRIIRGYLPAIRFGKQLFIKREDLK